MLNIIIKETKEFFSNKKIWIAIITVLIILIIGTSYNIQKPKGKPADHLMLGVINHDDSTYSKLLLEYFSGSDTFKGFVTIVTGSEKEVKSKFNKGNIDIYLEIPKDFASNMIRLKNSPVKVFINTSDTTKAILFENVLKSYERYISAVEENTTGLYEIMDEQGMDQELIDKTNLKVSLDLVFTALGKEAFFSFHPESKFPMTTIPFYYIGSILVMGILYFSLHVGLQVLQEMKQGTYTRLRTTDTPLYQFLLAKMFVIIVILSVVVAAAVYILCRRPLRADGLFFCLTAAMFGICQAVFLSALFRSTGKFILACNLLIFYFTVIGGGIIPIQFLPQDLLLLSKVTPYYYFLKGIIQINQGQYREVDQASTVFLLISIGLLTATVFLLRKRSVIIDEV